jgi:hypothetical protein
MSYSPALTYFLERLSGYSTNYFRLEPQNSTTAAPNQIIRFTLPSNALLNLRSFGLHFTASANKVGGAGARLPADISTLVDRVEVSCGGVQLSSGANYYNVLKHAKKALQGDMCDPTLGHPAVVREISYVDGATIAGTGNETLTGTQSRFCIDKWDGFLGSAEPKVMDSALVPDIVVSVYLADTNVLSSSAGVALDGAGAGDITDDGTGLGSYELSNIHATIECIGLADAVYDNMISSMIASKGFIEVPFKQYFSFQDTHSGQMRFSVATQSLDRIWAVQRDGESQSQVAPRRVTGYKLHDATNTKGGIAGFDAGGVLDTDKELYLGAAYNFPEASATARYQFQLNGAYVPQFKASFEEMYQISRNSVLGKPQDKMGLATMKANYAAMCVRLNLPESEFSRLISGLDTRSVSLNGYFNIDGLAGATPLVNLFAECTSTLRIGAGRMLEVIQ